MQIDLKKLIGEATEYDKKRSVERKRVKSWLKSVSAFANSFGGTLIWGITNDDEIVGLGDAESDAEFISETIKTKIDSIPKVNLRFHMEGDKKLILLDVYAGKEKILRIATMSLGEFWMKRVILQMRERY